MKRILWALLFAVCNVQAATVGIAQGGTGNTVGRAVSANAIKSATTTVDTSAATAPSAGQVLTSTSSTAATWQTPAGYGGELNVKAPPYNATGNGTTDDTAAIQAALTACTNQRVIFPPGVYAYTTLNIPNACVLDGFSPGIVTLKQTSATLNGLTTSAGYVTIEGIGFTSSVTKTAGSFILATTANNFSVANFTMDGAFIGITINGGSIINIGSNEQHASIINTVATTGIGIYITGSNFAVALTNILMDASAVSQPLAGIYVDNTGDVLIERSNIIHQGSDLLLAPGGGQVVTSVWAMNTFFDTAVNGLKIAPTSTGYVARTRFDSCWFGSHSNSGVLISGLAFATIQGVHFISPHILSNTGSGFSVSNGINVSDLSIIGGEIVGNSNGISFTNAISDVSIIGATIGSGGGIGANSGYGIYFGGTPSNTIIANNSFTTNTLGAFNTGWVRGASVNTFGNAGNSSILANTLSAPQIVAGTLGANSGLVSAYSANGDASVNHGYFENTNQAGRAQFIVTSGTYPENFFSLMTHGTTAATNYYATSIGATTDAGKAVLLGQGASMNEFVVGTYSPKPLGFFTNNTNRITILSGGNIGIGVTAPTARLHLAAGTATASSAPLKLTSGALLTTPEAGAFEFLTNDLAFTPSTVRKYISLRAAATSANPTISSGFGTTPSIVAQDGSKTFQVNVGTGGTATGGVIALNAAPTGWNCHVDYNGSSVNMNTYSVPTSATTVTLTNQTSSTGVAVAWAASKILNVMCVPY